MFFCRQPAAGLGEAARLRSDAYGGFRRRVHPGRPLLLVHERRGIFTLSLTASVLIRAWMLYPAFTCIGLAQERAPWTVLALLVRSCACVPSCKPPSASWTSCGRTWRR
jgi:hypothetical protein